MSNTRVVCFLSAAALCAAGASAQNIDSIEINQAIGKQLNGAANFVAGKATAIRAFMTADTTVDATQTNAVITKDGQQVATITPKTYDTPTRVIDFLCPNLDACGRWAAGSYVFQVTVNGVAKSTQGTTYNFQERQKLRILARPVKGLFSGVVKSVPNDSWKSMWMFTRSTYPISDDAITWDIRDEFDASNIDIDTEAGRTALWQGLTDAQPKGCADNPKADGCYNLIVGFIAQNPKDPTLGQLAGYTMGRPTNIVVATDSDAPATVAHEIAHTMGIGDTYPNGSLHCIANPAPDGFTGDDWDNRSNKTACTAGRLSAADIKATLIPATANPYEVGGRGALPDMACYMGEGNGSPASRYWTTPDTYDWLFKQLAPTAKPLLRLAIAVNAVDFAGMVTPSGSVQLQPWESYSSQDAIATNTGAYTVRAVDANGTVLASQGFDVNFIVLTNPPRTLATAPFSGSILFPANTVKFQILNGTTLLKEVPVSKNDPVVAQVTPAQTGQTIVAKNTITWSASDADGDALTYNVEYTPDVANSSADWELIADNIAGTSVTYDFSGLPGGQRAAIRVTANDGVRSGSALSAQFAVPYKRPEVFIDNAAGSNYETNEEIVLSGEASDLQDSTLPDANLVWSSNISGKLGTGGELAVTLPAGEHTLTLTATNSGGASASKSIVVRVGARSSAFEETPATNAIVASSNFGSLTASATLPAGSLTNPTEVSIEVTAAPVNAAPPSGVLFAGRYFNLTIQQQSQADQWTAVTSVPKGVTVTVAYNQPGDAASLKLFRWNTNSNTWVDAASECQPVSTYDRSTAGKIAVKVCNTGSFALAGNMQPFAASVLNGASFLGTTVSPGAFTSIFGSNLAQTATQAQATPLPITLGGVTVNITSAAGTIAAPLYYVSAGQINIQMPFEVPVGAATATVIRDGVPGPTVSFNVVAAGPGILLWGDGRAVAVNGNDGLLNSASTPVKSGSYLTVYMTGQGPLDNPVATGNPAPTSPLASATSKVTAAIGGVDSKIIFAGLAPGWIGLTQVNVVVPAVAGDQPLVVTIGGVASNSALVTVQP